MPAASAAVPDGLSRSSRKGSSSDTNADQLARSRRFACGRARLSDLSAPSVPLVRLLAVRHGETTFNAAGRLTGQLDPPLTARGREQAAALAPLLAGRRFDRFVHSGARRAADTLALARDAAGLGAAPAAEVDPRWRERSFGTLEGEPRDAWVQPPDDLDATPPGGESYRALAARVLAAVDDLRADAARAGRPLDVLLCAHSGVLRMLAAIAADAPDAARALDFGARNGEAVALVYAAPATPRFLASPSSGSAT
jgi:glucosyl-3-phosphoglycerate phosphatase